MFIFASELFLLLTTIITIMEKLRNLDVYFCKLSAKCKELFLLHAMLNKSYSKLISSFLDSDMCPSSDSELFWWQRFLSDEEPFEDWYRLVQKWKFWLDGDEDYLLTSCARLDSLVTFICSYYCDDLPF